MSFSSALASATGAGKGFRIGSCDWTDPVDVALCAEAVWRGRLTGQKERAEAQALRNIAFVAGDQWHLLDPQQRCMIANDRDITGFIAKPGWEKQLVFNRCMPVAEARLAKFMRAEGTPDPIPITDDPNDIANAEASADVIRAYWDQILDMPSLMARLFLCGEMMKTAFIKLSWNKRGGDPKFADMQTMFGQDPRRPRGDDGNDPVQWMQQQFGDLFGAQAAEDGSWEGSTGDVKAQLRTILDINVWPHNANEFGVGPTDYGQVQIVQDTYEMTAYEVAEMLDEDEDEIRRLALADGSQDGTLRDRQARGDWQGSNSGYGRFDRDNDSVRVHETYRVPCSKYKKGRMAFTIGKTCKPGWLTDINVCDAYKRPIVPMFRYTSKYVPTLLWGRCTIDDMIDPQRERNASASQEANYRNHAAMPHLFRFQHDGLSDGDISNNPGGQSELPSIEYMPKYLDRPPLGPEHARTFERATQEIYEIGGVGQVDYGGVEGGNPKAGVAINALQEQNDLRMLPSAKMCDDLGCKIGESIVYLIMKYGVDERVIRLLGSPNSRELGDFRGKDVKFTGTQLRPSTWDQPGKRIAMLSFQSYRNLPSTRAESRQTAQALMTTVPPILNPADPDDKGTLLRIFGVGNAKGYVDRDRRHIAKAQAEHDLWRQGQPVGPPNKTDRHQAHIQQHRDWMGTDEWDKFSISNPELAAQAVEHLETHLTLQAYDLLKPKFEAAFAAGQLTAEFRDKALKIATAGAQTAQQMNPGDPEAAAKGAQAGLEIAALFASAAPFIGIGAPPQAAPEQQGGAHNQAPPHQQGGNGQPQHGQPSPAQQSAAQTA